MKTNLLYFDPVKSPDSLKWWKYPQN